MEEEESCVDRMTFISLNFCIKYFLNILILIQARSLLKSLVVIGAICGLVLGLIGTSVPWLFPYIFTADANVIREVMLKSTIYSAEICSLTILQ